MVSFYLSQKSPCIKYRFNIGHRHHCALKWPAVSPSISGAIKKLKVKKRKEKVKNYLHFLTA